MQFILPLCSPPRLTSFSPPPPPLPLCKWLCEPGEVSMVFVADRFPSQLRFPLDLPLQRYYAEIVLNLQTQTEESPGVLNRIDWRWGCISPLSPSGFMLTSIYSCNESKDGKRKLCYLRFSKIIANREVEGTSFVTAASLYGCVGWLMGSVLLKSKSTVFLIDIVLIVPLISRSSLAAFTFMFDVGNIFKVT